MGALNNSSNIPSVPALWTEFQQSLRDTDSESLGFALDILRHNAESLDRVDVNASLSTASPAQREKIEKIISSVFHMQGDGEVQVFAESSGFIDGNECAQALIEQELWDSSELTVSLDSLYLSLFCTKKNTFPSPLPEVIGTPEAPGELSVKIQKHLQELREQCETLKKRSEEESDPEKKEKLAQEHEGLSKTLQERSDAYEAVGDCIQEAPELLMFSNILSERQEEYQRFAYRLNQGFDVLKAKNLECQFFAEDGGIADLPKVCFTGWHTRIEAMIEGSGQKRGAMMQGAHLLARDLRRSIMQEGVLRAALRDQGYREDNVQQFSMDVHYRQAVKQWANERFNLGYSQEELSRNEMMRDALSNSFEAVAQGVMDEEYPKALSTMLIDDFRQMNSAEREEILEGILSEYREGCRQDPTLLIDPLDERRALYEEMERANNLENPQERLSALREVRTRFTEEGIQSPFNLRTPYEGLEAELRMNYPRPFSRVFQGCKNASENERLNAMQEAFQSLKTEEKERDLEALLACMQESLSPEAQERNLQQQKEYISDRARGFEDFRINENVSLLERKLCSGQELSEFGAHLWLCSAKLLAPRNTTNIRAEKPAQILQWAYEQDPALSSAQVLEKLQEDPSLYFHLPQNLQELAEVREYLNENPWIALGAPSLEEYEHYLSQDPQTINLARAPAWVGGCKEVMLAVVRENGYALEYASEELQDDREIVLTAVRQNCNALRDASERLKDDREIVLAAVNQKGNALRDASERLKDDREIVFAAVSQKGDALQYASERLKNNHDIVLAAVSQNCNALQYASERLKDDREIVLAAVSQNGNALEYASERLKNNHDIVLAAVRQKGFALRHASERLKDDHDIVLAAVSEDGWALGSASKELKDDRDIVLAAVSQNCNALQYASERLKNNREIVLTAVSQNGRVLEEASKELKNDREIVLAAVSQDGYAFSYAGERLKDDREIVLAAVSQDSAALCYANERFKGDREIILAAVSQNGRILEEASERFKDDREIVLAAVSQNGNVLWHASKRLKDDHDIVLAAVSQKGLALIYASERLKDDREIVLAAVSQKGDALGSASRRLKGDREFMLAAVSEDGSVLGKASEELKNDRGIVLAAVSQNGHALGSANERLKNDHEIVLAAVSQNGYALLHASEELKNNHEIVLAAVSQNGNALEQASEELKDNPEIVRTAVSQNNHALQFASEELQREFGGE